MEDVKLTSIGKQNGTLFEVARVGRAGSRRDDGGEGGGGNGARIVDPSKGIFLLHSDYKDMI
jgi:hypothetical protein